MDITVAVCTYNRFDILADTLAALRAQTLDPSRFVIRVVDNSVNPEASAAFQTSLAGFENLDYVVTDRAGLSYARMVALDRCETPRLAFTDDDCLPEPDWLERLSEAFDRHPDAGAVGGRTVPVWEGERPAWLDGELLYPLALVDWDVEDCVLPRGLEMWLVGANIAFDTAAIRAVGGFDQSLGRQGAVLLSHEELDANMRLMDAGYEVVYAGRATVHHRIPESRMTKAWYVKNAFWDGVSQGVVFNRYALDEPAALGLKGLLAPWAYKTLTYAGEDRAQLAAKWGTLSTLSRAAYEVAHLPESTEPEAPAAAPSELAAPQPPASEPCDVIHIVTPCLNAAATIDETLTSVLTQAGDFRLRLHVQDAGSTDGTLDRLQWWREFLETDAADVFLRCRGVEFTFASEPDAGLYDGVSRGVAALEAARSLPEAAFMTWLNADDVLFHGALANVLAVSRQLPTAAWLAGVTANLGPAGEVIKFHRPYFPTTLVREGLCDAVHWETIQQEGLFWRKWLWDAAGGVDTSLKLAGDWDLWRRFAAHAPLIHAPFPLGAFRVRAGQLSSNLCGYLHDVDARLPREHRRRALKRLKPRLGQLEVQILELPAGRDAYELHVKQLHALHYPPRRHDRSLDYAYALYRKLPRPVKAPLRALKKKLVG